MQQAKKEPKILTRLVGRVAAVKAVRTVTAKTYLEAARFVTVPYTPHNYTMAKDIAGILAMRAGEARTACEEAMNSIKKHNHRPYNPLNTKGYDPRNTVMDDPDLWETLAVEKPEPLTINGREYIRVLAAPYIAVQEVQADPMRNPVAALRQLIQFGFQS